MVAGNLKASEAAIILKQSNLTNTQLYNIWNLCERRKFGEETGKGFLKRNEWIMALHLIKKVKLGYPVGATIPENLEQFLNEYEST